MRIIYGKISQNILEKALYWRFFFNFANDNNICMKKFLKLMLYAAGFIAAAPAAIYAQLQEFSVSPQNAASQYRPYPVEDIQKEFTPAPEGYVPFHLEHYGRHGSRWLIEDKNYDIPVEQLEIAERNGKLTPLGTKILAELKDIRESSRGRLGELTPLGAEQHRGIGCRMAKNFPEIFADGSIVDARSTVVIRCILSMLNETDALSAAVPGIKIHTDASERDMWYMNHHDPVRNALADNARKTHYEPFAAKHGNKGDFLGRLINDEKFAKDSIDSKALYDQLFEVALNMGSHPERRPILTDIFSSEEINDGWRRNNASWFLTGGNTALTEGRSALVQRHLLRNMIESADTTLASPYKSANLRFGHETMVLSLAVLLNLNDFGKEVNDLDNLAEQWRAYEVFPMACNIQMVFYRPENDFSGKDILVKVLLNEREMPISGLKPVSGPYYSWNELRETLLSKLTEPTDEQWEFAKKSGK